MIEPTSKDIGRFVVYVDDNGVTAPTLESDRISSFNDQVVFVGFPKDSLGR